MEFLDLHLVIEKIDFSLRFVLRNCQRNSKNIKAALARTFSAQVFSVP